MLQINVTPFQAKQLSSAQAGGQFDVVHLKHTALFCLPQERCQLLSGERFHLPAFEFWEGAGAGRIGQDEFLFYCQIQGRGDDLVDVPHRLGAEAFWLLLGFDALHSPTGQQFLIELLQFQRSEFIQRDAANVGLDVVLDVAR